MNIIKYPHFLIINKAIINQTIFFLLKFYLLFDILNGYSKLTLDLDLKLSVVFKSLLLFLILFQLLDKSIKYLFWFLFFIFMMLIGESISIFSGLTAGYKLSFLFQHIIKVLTPLIVFFWLRELVLSNINIFPKIHIVLKINFFVFVFNIFLGFIGFGFSTYGGNVTEDNSVGIKGFFYAGNEISMLWILFSGYFLNYVYNNYFFINYILISALTLFVGILISTKTSILAPLFLVFLIPFVIERSNFFNPKKLKFYLFLFCLIFLFILIFYIYNYLESSNMGERLHFIYSRYGFWGLILSGRDVFFFDLLNHMFLEDEVWRVLFGMGISYYSEIIKYSSELDFPDMFFWHGIFGLCIVLIIFFVITKHAFVNFFSLIYCNSASVFLTNMSLLLIANLSGHVFTSGMLGLLWGCFCATSYKSINYAYTNN